MGYICSLQFLHTDHLSTYLETKADQSKGDWEEQLETIVLSNQIAKLTRQFAHLKLPFLWPLPHKSSVLLLAYRANVMTKFFGAESPQDKPKFQRSETPTQRDLPVLKKVEVSFSLDTP